MLDGFLGWVVPLEVMVAVGEVDVLLVEDGGPLEGCGCGVLGRRGWGKCERQTMLGLASGAMAQLAVERLSPAQLVLDLAAMAVGLVFDVEVLALVVDAVGWALLPFGDASRRLAAALIFIHPED